MAILGVRVYEQATSVSTPNVAKVGIPFVVGTAPVQSAEKPARSNTPVLATSWDEAVEKLGFSYDWKKYTLCEFMYSHFQLFGAQPAIFCNVLDPAKMKAATEPKDYPVINHQVVLPIEAIAASLNVTAHGNGEDAAQVTLKPDEDFSVFYDRDDTDTYVCIVELLDGGAAYDAATLNIGYDAAAPETATVADVVDGVGQVDAAMTVVGTVPDLIAAPWLVPQYRCCGGDGNQGQCDQWPVQGQGRHRCGQQYGGCHGVLPALQLQEQEQLRGRGSDPLLAHGEAGGLYVPLVHAAVRPDGQCGRG